MADPGLASAATDRDVMARAVDRFRELKILLPTFEQLADPWRIPGAVRTALEAVGPDAAHPLNLFRVHWYNDATRRALTEVPEHVVLPSSFTGVEAPIVVALGNRFPLIGAHKVLAAYACLAPRLVNGKFDPTAHRAVWPSTGNYCRGGVAISRISGCRGVAVLPEGMSAERFRWLEQWVGDPADIVRTPGSESNVKEIYDRCRELERDPGNVILNQFSEFGNHLGHYMVTGHALEHVFESLHAHEPSLRMAAFVSATGSAGTIAAGDHLKDRFGAQIAAVEALECPTMLMNGFGSHNIQGIGDKHIPYIHNVMNTDFVVAVSDRATDGLLPVFNTEAGRRELKEAHGVPADVVAALPSFGLSSICNVLAAVKLAKHLNLGPDDAVFTVATDGADLYASEMKRILAQRFANGFGAREAGETFARYLLAADDDHVLELTHRERERIFNLGYFTWVEQHGVPLEDFEARRHPTFWTDLRARLSEWDTAIDAFNERTGVRIG